ncbi:DUF5059 domain-containing protein [Halobacteriales archaeon QS_6_71_20]|nr:MAG: DUF5059 domain-containing protein [Halobacteriales archaeon QS_6_71_20]
MTPNRRQVLATGAAALAGGLAGCGAQGETRPNATDGAETDGDDATATDDGADATASVGVEAAVAAEWNAMRARVWDAYALGVAGDPDAGAAVAQSVFARFEQSSGEHGAHETLESTDEAAYEEFEEALGELRTEGLAEGDLDRAREEAVIADERLASAQRALVGDALADALDAQLFGAAAADAGMLAAAGGVEGATAVAEDVLARFEDAPARRALEEADAEAYEAFEGALAAAAGASDAGTVSEEATTALEAALAGSYAVAGVEHAAGAGHMAALQARGWDAAALAGAGGPSIDYAHAASLTLYRARAYDARWLAARGETDAAATMAGDVFAHFEGAKAHEALEEADAEAYEAFEAGLSDLRAAIESGDADGVDEAVAAVDGSLVTGVEALAGGDAALLEAGFFRARFGDAVELYEQGHNDTAASLARSLFERFEANELDLHESIEETSEELYADFEEEHLSGLITAFEDADDDGVDTHYEGVQSALLSFEERAGSAATVSGAEGAYMAARGFDAAALDALGDDGRARSIAQDAFEHFEAGAGGFHEAVEEADEEVYEAFEAALGAIATAAGNGEDVYPKSTAFNGEALSAVYAVVEAGGGSGGNATAAASVLRSTFAHFEEARVHELIEEADHTAYETFEAQLEAAVTTATEGGDVAAAVDTYADATLWAQFALVDGVEELPISLRLPGAGDGSGDGEGDSGGESDLSGGPNVVEGVPEDADYVVDMAAVAFEPEELTVSAGDTVAFAHRAGEAHNVVAYGDDIPSDAEYWSSGGFDSESAAREGWENGEGAVRSGQSYVRTFEATGEHGYCCVPHEAAGMVGTVIVE